MRGRVTCIHIYNIDKPLSNPSWITTIFYYGEMKIKVFHFSFIYFRTQLNNILESLSMPITSFLLTTDTFDDDERRER